MAQFSFNSYPVDSRAVNAGAVSYKPTLTATTIVSTTTIVKSVIKTITATAVVSTATIIKKVGKTIVANVVTSISTITKLPNKVLSVVSTSTVVITNILTRITAYFKWKLKRSVRTVLPVKEPKNYVVRLLTQRKIP